MSFIRKFDFLIKKSNQNITSIDLNNGIKTYNYNSNFNLLSSKHIINGTFSFIDVWFDINPNDSIYGIVNVKNKGLIHVYINDRVIVKNTLLKYDSDTFIVQFPYIKKTKENTHIIYYLSDKSNQTYCHLIHYCKLKSKWIKNEIDLINYSILTNFIVALEDSNPIIFYFKKINGYEELFVSTFNPDINVWSVPYQITNSRKIKVYLSIIKTSNGYYNISYSENNFNKYYCTYLNGYMDGDTFVVLNYETISPTIACIFPNILSLRSKLYIQWIEYNSLRTCISSDWGKTWSVPVISELSSQAPFKYYFCKSNYSGDLHYNLSSIFACENSEKILGINTI